VNASASALRPGTYGPFIVFASGRGSTVRFVRLIVQGPSLPLPADQVERGREGICLTDAEDIYWTTAVTVCLRSDMNQTFFNTLEALRPLWFRV
jgi:hypothetical protein